jgi:hypothetical protein
MRTWLVLLVLVLLGACDQPVAAEQPRKVEPSKPEVAKARHEVMAEKVIAAIASGDVEKLRPLFGETGWRELQSITRAAVRRLRERLAAEKIELAKARIVRVVPDTRSSFESVDVHLDYGGRTFRTHFSVMTAFGGYELTGIANWIEWVK